MVGAAGEEGVDGAAESVVLHGDDDAARRDRAGRIGGEADHDVERLLRGIAGRIRGIADDQVSARDRRRRHSRPVQLTAIAIESVMAALPVAPVTHRSMLLVAPGLAPVAPVTYG